MFHEPALTVMFIFCMCHWQFIIYGNTFLTSVFFNFQDTNRVVLAGLITSQYFINEVLDDQSSSSSSDGEQQLTLLFLRKKLLRTNINKIEDYLENVVYNYSSKQFHENFRMSIRGFEKLLEMIGPILKRRGPVGRNTIPVDKQVLCAIWVLANQDTYR